MPLTKVAKIGISWSIVTALGVYGFVLSKRYIDNKRYESMKIRERIRRSNEGEYDASYRRF